MRSFGLVYGVFAVIRLALFAVVTSPTSVYSASLPGKIYGVNLGSWCVLSVCFDVVVC